MTFLTAEWRKLAMFSYEVDPHILKPLIPKGTEIDLFNGKCFISLVGFMFLNTRLRGISIPFHRHFEEVNLRFYVTRHEETEVRRGVVFIREIVPKPAITWVANTIYKEHYQTLPMRHSWQQNDATLQVSYAIRKHNKWQQMRITSASEPGPMIAGSVESFIAEHYWGYSGHDAHTFAYEVTHPSWLHYPIQSASTDLDFGALYGAQFAFLNTCKPYNVLLAEGSAIGVKGKVKLGMESFYGLPGFQEDGGL